MYKPLNHAPSDVHSTPASNLSIEKHHGTVNPWKAHIKKIYVACSLVTIPMVAFTIAIVSLVFINRIDIDYCPYPQLCHDVNTPDTVMGSDYYVDFPVGRLAFVSSLSSTISFTLIAAFMVLYSYTAARQLLEASDVSQESKNLPSPHDVAILVRLLNAEAFLLWDLGIYHLRRLFHGKSQSLQRKGNRHSSLVRACLAVLGFSIVGR
jgi:hypothetical protein